MARSAVRKSVRKCSTRLGFKHFAYDWRAEHLPTFQQEIDELRKRGISLDAVWFPGGLNKDAQFLLDGLARNNIKTELWVTGGGGPAKTPEEQRQRVVAEANRIRPIAEAAAKIGCKVGLYNHGGWFGEPENQLAILAELKLPNVGIVYNLHHGHEYLDRFPALLEKIKPHLLALNLNGMIEGGDRQGQKIVPLGQGDLDLELLKTIRDSGYCGPIGVLGHTMDDVEQRLQDNLDGLDWLVAQLDGQRPGPKPKPRTYARPRPAAAPSGWLAAGRPEYRTPPLTVECRARLNGKIGYNILVASDTKQSGAHWEMFSMAGNGRYTVYIPGMQPDHVRSEKDICDGQWHRLAFVYEPNRRGYSAMASWSPIRPLRRKAKRPFRADWRLPGWWKEALAATARSIGCRSAAASSRTRKPQQRRPRSMTARSDCGYSNSRASRSKILPRTRTRQGRQHGAVMRKAPFRRQAIICSRSTRDSRQC